MRVRYPKETHLQRPRLTFRINCYSDNEDNIGTTLLLLSGLAMPHGDGRAEFSKRPLSVVISTGRRNTLIL